MAQRGRKYWRLLGWTVIGLWLFFSMSLTLSGRSDAMAMKGGRQLRSGAYSQAVDSYRRAVRTPLHGSRHRYGYAVALFQAGRTGDALRELRSASPDDTTSNALGVCLLITGHASSGIRQFRKAIAERGDYAVYHHNLATSLSLTGDASTTDAERGTARELSKGASDKWRGLYFAPLWGTPKGEALRCAQAPSPLP